jgi:hypothetical protein
VSGAGNALINHQCCNAAHWPSARQSRPLQILKRGVTRQPTDKGDYLEHVEENGLHDPVLEASAQNGQQLAVQQRGQQDAANGRQQYDDQQAQLLCGDANEGVVGVGDQEAASRQKEE